MKKMPTAINDDLESMLDKPQPKLLRRSSSVSSTSSDLTAVKDNTCLICLMDFIPGETVKALECEHLYHEECLREWYNAGLPNFANQNVPRHILERHMTCPKCRRTFSRGTTVDI